MDASAAADTFITRLDAAETRLARLADHPFPAGLTEPEPGGEERWDAARVWAHLAEFPAFWTIEIRRILAGAPGEQVPFGRMKADPGRVDPIERDRLLPIDALWSRIRSGIDAVRALAVSLSPNDWDRVGQHVRFGPTSVRSALDFFIADHLEEHAAQLEKLATAG